MAHTVTHHHSLITCQHMTVNTTGLLLRTYAPRAVDALRPYFAAASLIVTCCCVGAPISLNIAHLRSPGGAAVLLPVLIFHTTAFVMGYGIARVGIRTGGVPLSRCICLTTGMQSSLLALLLASRFFSDPLTLLPCAISVPIMTLVRLQLLHNCADVSWDDTMLQQGGFLLVTLWKHVDARAALDTKK